MSLINQWAAWSGPTVFAPDATQAQKDLDSFRCRVSMAMVKTALDIQAEAVPAAAVPNRRRSDPGVTPTPRAIFARQVLQEPSRHALSFAQALAATGSDNTSTDQQIIDTVSAVWNALAGKI